MSVRARRAALVATSLALLGAAPADRLPNPRPEPCIPFDPDLGDNEIAVPNGLDYMEVKQALNAVIQTALHCTKPADMSEVHLTYELVVGCDGIISSIEASDDGGAPESYVECVASVVKKADFPAHDMADGMPVTYPVNVAW